MAVLLVFSRAARCIQQISSAPSLHPPVPPRALPGAHNHSSCGDRQPCLVPPPPSPEPQVTCSAMAMAKAVTHPQPLRRSRRRRQRASPSAGAAHGKSPGWQSTANSSHRAGEEEEEGWRGCTPAGSGRVLRFFLTAANFPSGSRRLGCARPESAKERRTLRRANRARAGAGLCPAQGCLRARRRVVSPTAPPSWQGKRLQPLAALLSPLPCPAAALRALPAAARRGQPPPAARPRSRPRPPAPARCPDPCQPPPAGPAPQLPSRSPRRAVAPLGTKVAGWGPGHGALSVPLAEGSSAARRGQRSAVPNNE